MIFPGLLLLVQLAAAQAVTGVVLDPTGAPIAGARVSGPGSHTTSAGDGTFSISIALPVRLIFSAPGFADETVEVAAAAPLTVVLQPRGITESLTVTASGARVSSPAAVTVLDAESLITAPALTLDEQLRSIPGFSLFRRSSSRVANPTTQGVTLRGMAASGASRATVVADGVTLNDPFGGWVYWDRVPAAAIDRVEVARGGASDVYGSDAMGGAVRIDTAGEGARVISEVGQDRTARVSAFGGRDVGPVRMRGGAEQFTTDGYVLVEPASRGVVDVPAWSRHSSLFASVESRGVELRGGYFSERRGNGTPVQANATTLRDGRVRARGDAWRGSWRANAGVAAQGYDQTFSAIARDRSIERLTAAQRVAATTTTAGAEWSRNWSATALFVAASARSTAANIIEQGYPASFPVAPFIQDARQRSGALTAQLSWAVSPRVTVAAGLRGELWRTRHVQYDTAHGVASVVPRASVAFRSSPSLTLRLSLQNAYRAPTMNELYRGFQVGNVYTFANPELQPEESYGLEGSALFTRGRLAARSTAFVTRVADAIVNVTIDPDPVLIERMRANAGRIRAAGVELESELRAWTGGAITASAACISSSFTAGELDGLRVPQVPRFQASIGARSTWRRASAALHWRYTSSQYDDDRNRFLLNDAGIMDARAAWVPKRGMDVFIAVENVLDTEQDVGRTPLRTIGLPRTARVGLRLFLSPKP